MKPSERILYFFILPILAIFLYPPNFLLQGIAVVVVAVLFFILLGYLQMSGRALALTFAIFTQGMNVIVRLMMFWNNSFPRTGSMDVVYVITNLIGLALSFWLLMRLDRQDVRLLMIR